MDKPQQQQQETPIKQLERRISRMGQIHTEVFNALKPSIPAIRDLGGNHLADRFEVFYSEHDQLVIEMKDILTSMDPEERAKYLLFCMIGR